MVKDAVRFVIEHCDLDKEEMLPLSVREANNLPALGEALRFSKTEHTSPSAASQSGLTLPLC